MSVSGVERGYNIWVNHVSDFEGPFPPEAYSLWADIDGSCFCDDQRYIGKLHRRAKYSFAYFCKHVVELYCEYASRALREGRSVLSPFIFPLDGQIEFERKVARQVLVQKKCDGEVKEALNRGEREWLNMANVSEQRYAATYTTDFSAARDAMRRMYLAR